MKIDTHHHFWKYSVEEYGWIDEPMRAIRRDFLPEHLHAEMTAAGIDGAISVQARQTLEETRWLLEMAAENDFIKAAVGWVPLIDEGVRDILCEFVPHAKFRGVRHVLQGGPDERYMLREDFNRGVSALAEFGLVYDLLVFERQLPQSVEFVDRHPNQVFVLDHIAKPRIGENVLEPWRANMLELARRENVFCKVSGMVTEADYANWTEAQLQPYLETALEAFGPKRLMFGSDWPVSLVASPYKAWLEIVERFASRLSTDEQASLFAGAAVRAYGLK